MDELPEADRWPVWQADMRLAIRGLSVVMSEQQAAHWCPIQINEELARHVDSADTPVPLVSTFLLDPGTRRCSRQERNEADARCGTAAGCATRCRCGSSSWWSTTGGFRFAEHLEQVADWADSLIVDVGPNAAGDGLQAWVAWNSEVAGPHDELDPITDGLSEERRGASAFSSAGGTWSCRVDLPTVARAIPVLGADAHLTISVTDREAASA